jgi:heat shock protein HtpX
VTQGILRLLSWEELSGVIGHELGHVKNRDILIQSIAATIGTAITYLAQFGFLFGGRSDDDEGGGSVVGMILMMILAPLAAMIIQMAISRSREYIADSTGAKICGHPLWLASALDKLRRGSEAIPMQASQTTAHMFIVHPAIGGAMANLFSTHHRSKSESQGSRRWLATNLPRPGPWVQPNKRQLSGRFDNHRHFEGE